VRDCQPSQAVDILTLLHIPCLNMAINDKNKIAVKQQEVTGTNQACKKSREVPEFLVVSAALKHQAAAPQAPRGLQDLGLPNGQETELLPAASRKPAMHFSHLTSFRFSSSPGIPQKKVDNLLPELQFHPIVFR